MNIIQISNNDQNCLILQYYLYQWARLGIIQFINIKWTSKPVCHSHHIFHVIFRIWNGYQKPLGNISNMPLPLFIQYGSDIKLFWVLSRLLFNLMDLLLQWMTSCKNQQYLELTESFWVISGCHLFHPDVNYFRKHEWFWLKTPMSEQNI